MQNKKNEKVSNLLPNVWERKDVSNIPAEVAQILSCLPQNGQAPIFLIFQIKTIGNIENSNVVANADNNSDFITGDCNTSNRQLSTVNYGRA